MRCPSCGNEIPEGSRFCNLCGTDLQTGVKVKKIGAKGVGVKPTVTSRIGMGQISRTIPPPGMCFYHPNIASKFVCAKCGRPICETCVTKIGGMVFCVNCASSIPRSTKRPTGVTVIAALVFIGTIFYFISGVTSMDDGLRWYEDELVLMGLIYMIIAVLHVLIGAGLLKGRNWARVGYLIFCTLGVILFVFGFMFRFIGFYFWFPYGIGFLYYGFGLLIELVQVMILIIFIWYLTRSHVKEFFGVT